jgi:hypothetical protein
VAFVSFSDIERLYMSKYPNQALAEGDGETTPQNASPSDNTLVVVATTPPIVM